MSLLDALERQQQRQDERTAAIAAVGSGVARAHAALEAARDDIKALESGVAAAGRRTQRALLLVAAAVALLALAVAFAFAVRPPPGPQAPVVSVISVPFPVVVPGRDDARTPASLSFEPDGNWAFRTRDSTQFADCGDEAQVVEIGAAPWKASSGTPRQLKLAELIRQERAGLVAVVVEAGHDARRVMPGARLADNAALAQQRVSALVAAVRSVLAELSVAVPVLPVARGASDEDASARCRDRQPRLTLIKHLTRGRP